MVKRAIWAVVPCKDLADAKRRLAGLLVPEERRALARAMLEDVLAALAGCRGLAGVMVVTRDPQASALATNFGARILIEAEDRGQTAAVTTAAQRLAAEDAAGLIAIPADVPLVTRAEVEQVLDAHDRAPAVTIVPALDGRGTNAVACSPVDAMPFRFGDESFVMHLAAARRQGIEPKVLKLPGLGLDIDQPEDLCRFLRSASRTRSFAMARTSGLAERCH